MCSRLERAEVALCRQSAYRGRGSKRTSKGASESFPSAYSDDIIETRKMNDPTADSIPLFRHDYERLKREVLRASEDVLLAAYCCSRFHFGYIVITSVRIVHVAFGTERRGRFGSDWGRGRIKIDGEVAIETRLIPKSSLTAEEYKTRQVFEMPLENLIRVERLQDVNVSLGRRKTRVVRLAFRVLRESTFDVDLFPRLLIFWDQLEGIRVYDLLVDAAKSSKTWFDQSSFGNVDIPVLAHSFSGQSIFESALG